MGICALPDCISCTVTEERNGPFTLELEYPRSGQFVDEITYGRLIMAAPYENAEVGEPFRIKEIDFDLSGNLVVSADHISYDLNYIIAGQTAGTAVSPAVMWATVAEGALLSPSNPFTFYSDIETEGTDRFTLDNPTPIRTVLGGMEGSVLDRFGGEFKWNQWEVDLLSARGVDNGVTIAYTKNLTGLEYNVDMSGVYTGAVAYYKGSDDSYVQGDRQNIEHEYGFERDIVLDASPEFDTMPNVAQLNTYAVTWLSNHDDGPAISVDVEFVPLWQTEEYKRYAALERVGLCDVVEVNYSPLNLIVKAKVVKTVFNVLAGRYDQITISSVRSGLSDTIMSVANTANANSSDLKRLLVRTEVTFGAKSIPANTPMNFSANIALDGYTPLGVVSIYSGSPVCLPYHFRLDSPTIVSTLIRNISGSAVTVTPTVQILWMKK
jgi:phage minor structural protein